MLGRRRPTARFAIAAVMALLIAGCAGESQSEQGGERTQQAQGPETTIVSGAPQTSPTIGGDGQQDGAEGAEQGSADSSQDQPDEPAEDRGPLPEPDWSPCGTGECATVMVPLDHADPTGPTTPIAIARRPATGSADERIGSIFVNFGGPGGEGVRRIDDYALPGSLGERFDAVLWDVRGVGGSAPLNCIGLSPDEPNTRPDGSDGFDDEVAAALLIWDETMDCVEDSVLVDHIGTTVAARDLDWLRRSVGDEELHYIGFSYGTQIGWVYATLFADTVGSLVLDGAVPPDRLLVRGSEDLRYRRFDTALFRLDRGCDNVDTCQQRDEGFVETIERLYDELEAAPLTLANGESFGPVDLSVFTVGVSYFETDRIGDLASTWLASLDAGNPEPMNDFIEQLSAGFDVGVFWSVVCADGEGSTSEADALGLYGDLVEAGPLTAGVGADVAFCHRYPGAIEPLPAVDTAGAAPILVVANTGDPATPYAWSVELDQLIDDSVLLTFDGGGHTIVGRGDACITGHVERYMLDGELPATGARCGPDLDAATGWLVPVDG